MNQEITVSQQTHAAAMPIKLNVNELAELGLKPEDESEILAIAQTIDPHNKLSIAAFGRDEDGESGRDVSDELLQHVRNKDLEEAGEKLGQVVQTAKRVNLNALSDTRSRVPYVGPLIDKAVLYFSGVKGQFESASTQISTLVQEVDQTQRGLAKRNETLEGMFDAVSAKYRLRGLQIAAGKLRLAELRERATSQRATATTPAQVLELADLDAACTNLDIRIGNLIALQQSDYQTLPQIRIVQTNNQVLVDKFYTIKEVTVPAWKRQFALRLGLNEQRNAVELAKSIDDATNEMLRSNAQLLHRNSVEAAAANQRLVIDVATLQNVQDTLIQTVEDVIKINRDGVKQRAEAERQIVGMRDSLKKRLTNAQTGAAP